MPFIPGQWVQVDVKTVTNDSPHPVTGHKLKLGDRLMVTAVVPSHSHGHCLLYSLPGNSIELKDIKYKDVGWIPQSQVLLCDMICKCDLFRFLPCTCGVAGMEKQTREFLASQPTNA